MCGAVCVYALSRRGGAYCVFRPKAHKEEKDPGSHSLCIGSQADKEGKVEKVEAGGIRELGGKKKLKILQLHVMSYDVSR